MKYDVGQPIVSGTQAATLDAAKNPSAVLIVHGVGQQVPFETVDTMARGICDNSGGHVRSMTARTIRVDCETLQRLELEFDDRPPVHIYEGYWAPLTEGVIGIWEVIRFIVAGAVNGVTSRLKLRRFLFGAIREFPIRFGDVLNIVLAVLVILSIVVVGVTIIVVGTASLAFRKEAWITAVLPDLTVIFEMLLIVVVTGVAVGALLLLVRSMRPLIALLAAAAGAAFFATAIAIFFAFIVNEEPVFNWLTICPIPWWVLWSHQWISTHGGSVQRLLQTAMAYGLFGLALMFLLGGFPRTGIRIGRLVCAALLAIAGVMVYLMHDCGSALALATWAILLGIALLVRRFVIQYAGDAAIYVSSHYVDRFFAARREIKQAVWKSAHSVYAYADQAGTPVYRRVIVAGHSLGSVVAYDTLNRLMNEDNLVGGSSQCCDDAPVRSLDVRGRTKLFLTFGSPLDKTAFIFATHAEETGSERQTLASSVQPLILEERPFPWTNVYSPQDIISGSLEFYDKPSGYERNRVVNVKDDFARTPLKAHVEYWEGTAIYLPVLEAMKDAYLV